jgi:hypothetical protein
MHYNVKPRYTPGSPAMVDERIARRVVQQERQAYEDALSGAWGEKERQTAEKLGLEGIVEEVREKSGALHVLDLITGSKRIRKNSKLKDVLNGDRVVRLLSSTTAEQVPSLPFKVEKVVTFATGTRVVVLETDFGRLVLDKSYEALIERAVRE